MRSSSTGDNDGAIVGLVVDQDPAVRSVIRKIFERRQGSILSAETAAEAREVLRSRDLDAVFIQPGAPGAGSVDWLASVVRRTHAPILVELSGAIDLASEFSGLVFERVPMNAPAATLEACVGRIVELIRLRRENRDLRQRLQARAGFRKLVGRSEAMSGIRDQLDALASNPGPVWIHGEPGSGRKRIAAELHRRSAQSSGTWLHVRATSLGSVEAWRAFEAQLADAPDSTVVFESPESLNQDQQTLLRLAVARHPGIAWRFVSTTGPAEGIASGALHSDWAETAAEATIALPRLRDRPEDIPLLANHFLEDLAEINRMPELRIGSDALGCMERYSWPGNVAELRNCIEHAAILASTAELQPEDLPDRIREATDAAPADSPIFRDAKREIVSRFECRFLTHLMRRHRGNVTAAAESAGMLRSALQRLLRKHDLKSAQFRGDSGAEGSAGYGADDPS